MDDSSADLAFAVFAAALSADSDHSVAVDSKNFVPADRIHRLADAALLEKGKRLKRPEMAVLTGCASVGLSNFRFML